MAVQYFRISPKLWRKARARGWTDAQINLAIFLLTNTHRKLEGLYLLPKPYIASDLGWSMEKVEDNLAVLLGAGFAKYDEDAEVVLIPKALKFQSPSTEMQIRGAIAQLRGLPRTCLWDDFRMACKCHCQKLADAVDEAWPPHSDATSHVRASTRGGSSSTSISNSTETPAATPLRSRAESSRSQAETVKCPRCGSEPGAKCMGVRKERESCHLERHHAVGELKHLPLRDEKAPAGPQPYKPDEQWASVQAEYFPDLPVSAIEGAAFTLKLRKREPTVDAIRALLGEAA